MLLKELFECVFSGSGVFLRDAIVFLFFRTFPVQNQNLPDISGVFRRKGTNNTVYTVILHVTMLFILVEKF